MGSKSPSELFKKSDMIFLTQLIYIKDGQEAVFHQFEDIAIPAISKYNGRLLIRVRPDSNSMIEDNIGNPYEIHLVQFDTEQDFQDFNGDEERKKFLHLKEQSVKSVLLIKGEAGVTPEFSTNLKKNTK
jgi:uncharacterized protein (DUF1330 family)